MLAVKVISVRYDSATFQNDINHAIANGWQIGQLSTCSNGGVDVTYTMVMTKVSNVISADSPNVDSTDRDSLQMAVKWKAEPQIDLQMSVPNFDQPSTNRSSQWDDGGPSFHDK